MHMDLSRSNKNLLWWLGWKKEKLTGSLWHFQAVATVLFTIRPSKPSAKYGIASAKTFVKNFICYQVTQFIL